MELTRGVRSAIRKHKFYLSVRLIVPVWVVAVCVTTACGGRSSTQEDAGSALKTPWGTPDLAGVWRVSAPLGATPSQDTFNLKQLEALYKPDARERIGALSAK